MTTRVLVDGGARDEVSVLDRGLAYGDGLFETIRFVGTGAPLWSRHMQRLQEGCRRLRLPPPEPSLLLGEACQMVTGMDHAVVRISVTRGCGARGYAPPLSPQPTRIVAAFAPPPREETMYAQGVRLHLCQLRLAEQPLLAGLKHLNRLEQVLARAEWDDPAIAEGLLCDQGGRAICATAANFFAVIDGVLATPALDRCGVAGVARAEVLAAQPAAQVRAIPLGELAEADELFLSSSVRGILPVRELDGRPYAVGPVARALQAHWRTLGF